MVVYLDRVFLLNLLVDYLLLLSAAQLSGRTLSRLRLLLCALAVGGGLVLAARLLGGGAWQGEIELEPQTVEVLVRAR